MGHVFDYKSKTCWSAEGAAMTVLNRTDTLVDELTADITNTPLGYGGVDGDERWAAEIRRLAHLRGATVLAHNYQLPAIQDVADHVGDSLALSRVAAEAPEDTIVFCGVHFMAETAKILSPHKTVLIPISGPAVRWPIRSPPTSCAPGRTSIPAPSSFPTSTPRRPSRRSPTSAAPRQTPSTWSHPSIPTARCCSVRTNSSVHTCAG